MNKFNITTLGSCLFMLLSASNCGSASAAEPAELKSLRVRTSKVHLTEETAKYLEKEFDAQPNDDSKKLIAAKKLKHSQLFLAESVDLNGDKSPELIVTADPDRQDIPMHNPPVVVLAKVNGKYKTILADSGGLSFLRTKTGAYKDLCIAQHASAAESEIEVLKFANGRYKIVKCFTMTYVDKDGLPIDSPRYIKHSCK